MFRELNWRLLLLGGVLCVIAAAAIPYITLKLGMSTDVSFGGMFLAANLLGKHAQGKKLAIELNIIQTMISAVSSVGFMCVILAAFHYVQVVFNRDIGFHPAWWQVAIWIMISASLGVFMGAIPRQIMLSDTTLPWPGARAVQGVIETLTSTEEGERNARRRTVLEAGTGFAAFISFFRDGFGVITPMIGNAGLKLMFTWDLMAIGTGLFLPLSVGLSGLIGVWFISEFGDYVSKIAALAGTTPENYEKCMGLLDKFDSLKGAEKEKALLFLTEHGGKAAQWMNDPQHFKYMVQWMMWPATAMMIAAALTSILGTLLRPYFRKEQPLNANLKNVHVNPDIDPTSDEHIPLPYIFGGIAVCVVLLVIVQSAFFGMPWQEVLVAIGVQPILILGGLRVVGITGQGPVSLMANATQFVFGLFWPGQIAHNLNAAQIAADPQASSETTIGSFWIARRIGGRFRTLIDAQLLSIPIGALLLFPVFNLLVKTYGIGSGPKQLAAPTGLKIAALAMVMEKGVGALPHGALMASGVAALIGIVLECLLLFRVKGEDGVERTKYSWVPIPSAVGFALIIPPPLTLGMALGSVISAIWKKVAPEENGSFSLYMVPLGAGFVAGEALVGSILMPLLLSLEEVVKAWF